MGLFYENGAIAQFSSLLPQTSAPLDVRLVVLNASELTNIEAPYLRMVVGVVEDETIANVQYESGIYYLSGSTSTELSNWTRIGGESADVNLPDYPTSGGPYYLSWNRDDNEYSWLEVNSTASLTIEGIYVPEYGDETDDYTTSSGAYTTLTNQYYIPGQPKELRGADVVAVKNIDDPSKQDSFHLMLNPELVPVLVGTKPTYVPRVDINVLNRFVVNLSELKTAGENIGVKYLYDHELISTSPTDAIVTWYSNLLCTNELGVYEEGVELAGAFISSDTASSGDSLTVYCIGRKSEWKDSYIKEVKFEVEDDKITATVTFYNLTRTNSTIEKN